MQKFMVIERFKEGCWDAAYEGYHVEGRLLPDGLNYQNSWANHERSICYQLMETSTPKLFDTWFSKWNDLVDFELISID